MPKLHHDPLNRPATKEEIKARHQELETAPILVFGSLFDCDERSERRMRDALATWDARPLEPGVFEERGTERVIIWTLGDNTQKEVTKVELESIIDEMVRLRAERGAKLFARYRQLKAKPTVTARQLLSPETWGI